MRILHISPDFAESCGMSRYVYLLLEEYQKYNSDEQFFITNHETAGLEKIKKVGIPIAFINFERGNKNPFKLLINIFKLYKFCAQNKIDVIHTHHRYPELLAFLVSKFTNVKTVTTAHSFVKGLNILSFKSDQIIAVSKAVMDFLISVHRIDGIKITHMYNFVSSFRPVNDQHVESIRNSCNIKSKNIVLLFVGRINYIKGCDALISAFITLSSSNKDIKLMIVGRVESPEIEVMIKLNTNIICVGPVSDVTDYYYLSDMVVMPSREEPLGYVAIEAGLARKPFVGSRTGGITEIVEDGNSGLLCEPGNVSDLIDKIKKYLDNPSMAKEHSENLYERVKFFQNGQSYVNALKKIYLR